MTAYRGGDEPPREHRPRRLWLTPGGRGIASLYAVASVLFLAVSLALGRVESPVALVSLLGAVIVGVLFERMFSSIVIDGDRIECQRGLVPRRVHRVSVAAGCSVNVVTAGQVGKGTHPPAPVHLVEVATNDATVVFAEERDRRVAEGIADWVRANLPAERLRIDAIVPALESSGRTVPTSEAEAPRSADEAPVSLPTADRSEADR